MTGKEALFNILLAFTFGAGLILTVIVWKEAKPYGEHCDPSGLSKFYEIEKIINR